MTFGNFFPQSISNNYNFAEGEIKTDRILAEKQSRPNKLGEEFVLSNHWGDQLEYMRMANHEKAISPFQFRVLYPFIISLAIDAERASLGTSNFFQKLDKYRLAQLNFWAFNFIVLLLSIFLFHNILRFFTDDQAVIFATIVLFVTQRSVLNTACYAMVDIFAYFMFLAVFDCLIRRRFVPAGVLLVLSVLSKESFIIWTPALIGMACESRDIRYVCLAFLPVIPFVLVRLYFGTDPMNVSWDWSISHGGIKSDYLITHLGSLSGIILQVLGMISAFSVLWLYIGKVGVLKEYRLKYLFVVLFSSLLLAQLVLSAHIARVLAPIFPLFALIPVIYLANGPLVVRENRGADT